MGELFTESTWQQIIDRIYLTSGEIKVPDGFKDRVTEIDILLDNDYTGIIRTIYDFMVSTATVPFTFVTDNQNLTDMLQDWADNELNRGVNIDIPKGLRELSGQYYRERWRSSCIILNIVWDKVGDYILPKRMWISDSASIQPGDEKALDKQTYKIGQNLTLESTTNKTILIRKPFDAAYKKYATPYLVGRGVLYNGLIKKRLVQDQARILEEIIPYLLVIKAGDAELLRQKMMTNLESKLDEVKDSLKKYKRDYKYRHDEGDSILKARYDLNIEHIMPDLKKIFDEQIIKPVNWNILAGLGLVELQGFSSTRQEAILNPKVLVEEIIDAILDWKLTLEEIVQLIIDKNMDLHKKHMNKEIRIIPGILKAFLTESMQKLIKDYANTGQLSLEASFEALPFGFDFKINREQRIQERDKGDEDLFFPRVVLNQDSNIRMDAPIRPNATPNEIPKKKKDVRAEEEIAIEEELSAPYENVDNLPENVKNVLPLAAQVIWLRTFNAVYKETGDEDKSRQAAWRNVELKYHKNKSGTWIKT